MANMSYMLVIIYCPSFLLVTKEVGTEYSMEGLVFTQIACRKVVIVFI